MENKFTVEEVAEKLKVSKKTILREIARGKLKTEKVGRRHLVSESALNAYLGKSSESDEKLIKHFLQTKKSEMIAFLQRMVATPSITSELGSEAKLAQLIKHKLNDWGIRSVVYKEGDAIAVRASYGYADEGILLDCPLDTIPAGDLSKWSYPPYEGVIKGGRMYGRGTADCKGGIAAMLYTILLLKTFVDEEKVRVELVFDGGEQDGEFLGMKQVVGRGLAARAGIIGYAGDYTDILIGARGYHRYEFETKGKAVHTGSRFKPGVNAISKMAKLMGEIENINFSKPKNELFSFGSRLTFSQISGGKVINMVPDSCVSKLDVRVIPEMNKKLLDHEIKTRIEKLQKADEDFAVDYKYLTGQEAYLVPEKEKIVKSLVSGTKAVLKKDLKLIASGPAHVGNFLNDFGISMLVFGPKGENVHSYDEYVEIDSVPETAEVYFKTVMNYFGLDSSDLSPRRGHTDVDGWT